ncbi:MAG: hypothetical protein JJE04_18455 [Acidobacteriia bacterium]|nr:hypothetical protein [Terriglobia bacterium]
MSLRACQNSVDEIGALAASNPIERAVIDVRNNGGGDSSVIKPLIKSMIRRFSTTPLTVEEVLSINWAAPVMVTDSVTTANRLRWRDSLPDLWDAKVLTPNLR